MHNKFIIFGDEDVITGSFNITFDRWWANWESGMTFRSRGVCRLLQTGPEPEQTLVAILQSLPGAGRIVLATLLEEAFETLQRADYPILRILCGVAPSPGDRAKAAPSPEGSPAIQDCGTPFTTWRTPRGVRKVKPSILL